MVLRNKYTLNRLIGVGGMAAVYSATHRNGSRVAIKVLHPQVCVSAEAKSRFLREGTAANAVAHPGVVKVSDDDVDEQVGVFLVMELLEGTSLDRLWETENKRLPVHQTLSVAYWLLDVLVAAHRRDILHRDIKPENVFLTNDGTLKLVDFGIARMRQIATQTTKAGTALGTPAFMAPEQAMGYIDKTDARSDLFSVGAVMFTVLSGRDTHEGKSPSELLVAAATKQAPALREVAPWVPESVAAIVDRALCFDKEKRWESAEMMQQAVAAAHEELFEIPMNAPTLQLGVESLPGLLMGSADRTSRAEVRGTRTPEILKHSHAAPTIVESSDATTTINVKPSWITPAPQSMSAIELAPRSRRSLLVAGIAAGLVVLVGLVVVFAGGLAPDAPRTDAGLVQSQATTGGTAPPPMPSSSDGPAASSSAEPSVNRQPAGPQTAGSRPRVPSSTRAKPPPPTTIPPPPTTHKTSPKRAEPKCKDPTRDDCVVW